MANLIQMSQPYVLIIGMPLICISASIVLMLFYFKLLVLKEMRFSTDKESGHIQPNS